MSKERLEEIKERRFVTGYDYNPNNTKRSQLDDDFQWLIEQAEQYAELKKDWDHTTWQLAGEINLRKQAEEQNKRYREAINFAIDYLKNSDIRQVQLVVTGLKSALEEEEK